MTLLWTTRTAPAEGIWQKLPSWKVQQLLCLHNQGSRAQSLLAWSLLGAALGPALGRVERTGAGKPYLPQGPYFSLTHCPGLAALALAPAPVGLDAEPLNAFESRAAARLWTARECWGKCRGTGPAGLPPAPSLWAGTLPGPFVVSLCTLWGSPLPEKTIEWNGGPICTSRETRAFR